MGWFVSPKILLLIVCVYDAWVFSQEQCRGGEMFCEKIQSCTTQDKCYAAKDSADLRVPPCQKGEMFCPAIQSCTTKEKCHAPISEKFPTGMPTRPECPEDQMFCLVTGGCTSKIKCDATFSELFPTGIPTRRECPEDQMFCGAIQSCTTKEKCDVAISEKFPIGMPTRPECPEGQMFCKAIQSCTTREKCDVAISEKFPTGMPTRPECPEGQMFCKAIKGCTTREKCDVAISEKFPTGMPTRPECPEGQIFCKAIKGCTTREKCDVAISEKFPTRMPTRPECPEGQMFCKAIKGCTTREKCDVAISEKFPTGMPTRPECPEGQMFCKAIKGCTTREKCDVAISEKFPTGMPTRPECPEGQMFCKAIKGCTTKEKCGVAISEKFPTGMPTRPECPEGQMFCKAIKDCTTKEKCDVAISKKFPTGMPTRPECPEGQMFCKATKDCTTREKCDVAISEKFPTGMPTRLECPEGQMFCKATKDCTTREKCDVAISEKFPTGMPTRPECPEGQMFCKATKGCTTREKCDVAISGKFPTGMPTRPECSEGQMFCKATKDCTTREKCDVAISEKFPTGMPTRPECPEGQMFCKAIKGCTTKEKCGVAISEKFPTGMPTRPECPEGQMFCKATKDCTTREKCDVAISEKFPTGMPTRPECPEGQMFCKATKDCTTREKCDVAISEKFPTGMPTRPECPERQIYCKTSEKCTQPKECSMPTEIAPTLKSKQPPKNKKDYFFAGKISANIGADFNPGETLGKVLKDVKFNEVKVQGMLQNVKGRWQFMKSTIGRREKSTWSDVEEGFKISPKDKIRFLPADPSVHGFEGIEVKIKGVSKYIGLIILPCVVPKLVVKKELSGEEEKPLNFNLDDVFDVTREQAKEMVSNLKEEYNFAVPDDILEEYRRMLRGGSYGNNLGIMVKKLGRHRLMEQREEEDDDKKNPKLSYSKIFAVGSRLVFRPAKDVHGIVKVMIFPVDLPPNTKDIMNTCGVGEADELIINITNVNDNPSPRPISPNNPDRLRLIVDAPPLPYELADHAANEGFSVGKFAKKVGIDVDGDELGIALVQEKVANIGQWQYFDDSDVWQNINLDTVVNKKGMINATETTLLFLTPEQKLRFKPSKLNKVWNKIEARQTILRFILWDQSDRSTSGSHMVNIKDNTAISRQILSVTMQRLGCDGRLSSGFVQNECGECGKKSCKRCDGTTDSDAIINDCGICVLGTTGRNETHGKDCNDICNGPHVNPAECPSKCIDPTQGKKFIDCSGTCFGTKRLSRCQVCSDDKNAGSDACGVCGGDNSTCEACDGKIGSSKILDVCGECRDPDSSDFNTGCTKLAAIKPKIHQTGQKIVYKLDASGFPKSGATCELRLDDVRIPLEVTVDPIKLTVERVDNVGVYNLVCTIGGQEYSLKKAVTVFGQQITVSSVQPSEVAIGSEMAEVTITGEGFMDSGELFCIYSEDVQKKSLLKRAKRRADSAPKFTKRQLAIFVSSTQCKCEIDPKISRKIKVAVALGKAKENPDSYVEVTVMDEAVSIKSHKLNYRTKQIFITFTKAVKRKGGCAQIFNEVTINKLKQLVGERDISCKAKKADQLVIHLPGAVMQNDLEIVFKPDAIVAEKGFSRPSGDLRVVIKAPEQRSPPVAVITAPKMVGSCDGMKISAKNSKNTGKRGYECTWNVSIDGVDDESSLDSSVVDDLAALRDVFTTKKCVYAIDATKVLEGYKYMLKLVVSNREGSSTEVAHIVERSAKDIPSVRFITTAKVFYMRKKQFFLKVQAKKPKCIGNSKLVFSWISESHPTLVLPNDDSPRLVLKREMLECDESYVFGLSAYLDSNPDLAIYLTYNLTTKSAPLKFGINGGDQVVPSNSIVKLTARAISDVTCGGKVQYIFTCIDEDGFQCVVKNENGKPEILPEVESSSLRIKANRFVANKTYTFKLGVYQGIKRWNGSVKVKIAAGNPPSVQIMKPKDAVSPVVIVFIKSSAEKNTSFQCENVVEQGYGYIDFEDKTKVTGEFKGQGMKFNQRRLRFKLSGLPSGVEYKVRCYAYHDDTPDEIGESTTSFKIESPPEGGALSLEPAEGVSSETSFSIVASEFMSDSSIIYSFYTKNKKGKRVLLASKTERSIEIQLPAGEGELHTITIIAVAENEFGRREVEATAISRPKRFNTDDFDDIAETMKNMEDEGVTEEILVFAFTVASSAEGQDDVKDKMSELQENTAKIAVRLIAEKRKEGTSDVKEIFALTKNIKPETEESKQALGDEVSSAVEGTVPQSTKRRSDTEKSGGRQRRRRALENENVNNNDESGMSPSEVEDILATFENLIDTTVVNNNTENFLQTVDSLLINMCTGLPLGENSLALSSLGVLKADMNYLDNVDTNFLSVACANCSTLNNSALVKFGNEIKQMYSEWNCSGDEELCNGLCAAMTQTPHDYLTAVMSPVRLSDVVYIELKNPENQDYVPVSNLAQPVVLHIPLHAGHSQTSGHKCMIWSESEEQWSTSGCQKTQAFINNDMVYVECSCTKLGYITVHESDDDNILTTTELITEAPTTTGGTTMAQEKQVATVQFSFDVDYHAVIRDAESKKMFLKSVEDELAEEMQVDKSLIVNITVAPGSIVVSFILLAEKQNPTNFLNYSITELRNAVNDGEFTIMFNNQQLTADNGTMTFEYKTMSGVSPDETGRLIISEEDESKLPMILGAVFGFLLIVLIIGAILFRRHLAQQAKVSHEDVRGNYPMKTNCVQNSQYEGPPVARPRTPGNAAPLETKHSAGGPGDGGPDVRQTAQLPHVE